MRLDILGLGYSESQRLMKAAYKFHGKASDQLFEAAGNTSKLFVLLVLEDDEIATLKAGGEVHGITLTILKTMTAKEVKSAIRGGSILRNAEQLSGVEAKLLQIHRLNTRNVQDVTDKHAPAVALVNDLFSIQPVPHMVAIPSATGFHVAALQLVNPIGTWRLACDHVNQGTRHANVTFRPAPARAGYRSGVANVKL